MILKGITLFQTHGEFNWDSQMQGIVLSSFYYGYLVTQVPGGALAERYGGKRIFLVSLFLSALFTCLGPVAARVSPILLCVVRACQGLAEGPIFPTMYAMAANWLPKNEKSFLMSCLVTGKQLFLMILMNRIN